MQNEYSLCIDYEFDDDMELTSGYGERYLVEQQSTVLECYYE